MARVKSVGVCDLCGKSFGKAQMTRHLQACRKKLFGDKTSSKKQKTSPKLHIVVDGSPYHWLHLQASAHATLADLDQLLRDTWLECCGHLSDFDIEGRCYSRTPMTDPRGVTAPYTAPGPDAMFDLRGMSDTDEQASMEVPLGHVLRPGLKFRHTYDYGSTTELKLRVVSVYEAPDSVEAIEIQARNSAPVYPCVGCGQPAVHICTECMWDGNGFLCDECLAEHECGDEMVLPVVDSPRMGVCGYTG